MADDKDNTKFTPYVSDWLEEYLGVPVEEAGLSHEDLKKLLDCWEFGKRPDSVHLSSTPLCACNICRS